MSPSQSSANSNVSAALTKSMHDNWGLYLGEVIVLVLLGLAAIIFPFIAGIVVTVFLGWLFLIAGIVGLVSTERLEKHLHFFVDGRIYVLNNQPWTVEFRNELVRFPVARHDDQLDALTLYLEYMFSCSVRHICAGSSSSLAPTIIKCGFIDRWTRMPLSIGRSCTSAPSHHDLFSAACITTIAESELSTHTMVERRDLGQGSRQLQERHGSRWLRERRPYASQMTPLAVIDAKPAHPRQIRQSQFPSG